MGGGRAHRTRSGRRGWQQAWRGGSCCGLSPQALLDALGGQVDLGEGHPGLELEDGLLHRRQKGGRGAMGERREGQCRLELKGGLLRRQGGWGVWD